ncbi:MAG: hypothetical protein Q4B04_05620, partial [bacterium]|nr:hypothetical protein [bacterium]
MGVLIKFRKSVMAFIKLLSVVSVTCLFVHVWQNYYSESLYSYKGNFVVVFCYLVILVAFTVLYSGFSIGVLRLHEVIYSGCLSLFFTNFITYFILCLI